MTRFFETKFFRHFLPFMILVIGGSFYIQQFARVKFKYRNITTYDAKDLVEKYDIKKKKLTTLEEEYEKLKDLDIDNWENIRIPRPWEDPNNVSN
ncbi:hypothetical protein WN48_04144 [Eufriesea mexicana]|uniref:Cytochrome c oxidase assembly protein COX16 homolog, mitochondrial n=1 Tax=Eufriesea mexicana TaxID=516756 RepID=A0A310SA86_9HYME|nr:PREDICTED: cytochrome c oxidase assembly protein COX16 homolog, mitochondrial [Eufriesea mexicana]OAD55894.1 hypothetical protein WN48_04144 [Eufriesea mexicana]